LLEPDPVRRYHGRSDAPSPRAADGRAARRTHRHRRRLCRRRGRPRRSGRCPEAGLPLAASRRRSGSRPSEPDRPPSRRRRARAPRSRGSRGLPRRRAGPRLAEVPPVPHASGVQRTSRAARGGRGGRRGASPGEWAPGDAAVPEPAGDRRGRDGRGARARLRRGDPHGRAFGTDALRGDRRTIAALCDRAERRRRDRPRRPRGATAAGADGRSGSGAERVARVQLLRAVPERSRRLLRQRDGLRRDGRDHRHRGRVRMEGHRQRDIRDAVGSARPADRQRAGVHGRGQCAGLQVQQTELHRDRARRRIRARHRARRACPQLHVGVDAERRLHDHVQPDRHRQSRARRLDELGDL